MVKGLTKYQLHVLEYLGLNGPDHILSIQEHTGINYATTHRSVKTLEKNNHVWLQEKESRGPKGAQTYSLTPYGIIELYLRGNPQHLNKIIEIWAKITPCMIANHISIEEKIPLKKILQTRYPYTVHPYKTNTIIPWRENILQIHKNILDTILIDTLNQKQLDEIITTIKNDPKYRETWKRWFSIKTLLFQNLKEINKKINQP